MGKIDIRSALNEDFEAPYEKHVDLKKPRLTQREKRIRWQSELIEVAGKLPVDIQQHFQPSFTPDKHERAWLLEYLEEFYENKVITDILSRVKGGKEATVYCCTAHPSTGLDLIAAKVYRPRMFRNLRNDAVYREGREVVDKEGKAVHSRREMLAILKNTRYGQQLRHTSWLEAEFHTMQILYDAGADVPRPLAYSNNVILMEYVGAVNLPAPALNQVHLERTAAQVIYDRLIRNLEIMLSCQRIHADFSAYNVLFWEGQPKIIDFPQAVDPRQNAEAPALFVRDVVRMCQYFERYHLQRDAHALANDLWSRYQRQNWLEGDHGDWEP